MPEYEVVEKDGKKIRLLPQEFKDKENIQFIAPIIMYKTSENLKNSMKIANKAIELCDYRRPSIIFSKEQIFSAMSVNILQKYYDRSVKYRVMEGTDLIAAFLGESTEMSAEDFNGCDLLFINMSLINEVAMRALAYLDVQVVERMRNRRNTIVFYEGTKQNFVAKGGVLKHFTNVVDTVSMIVSKGNEEIKGKSFNEVVTDRSVKRVDPYC